MTFGKTVVELQLSCPGCGRKRPVQAGTGDCSWTTCD